MRKRLFSFILSFIFCVSTLSAPAYASALVPSLGYGALVSGASYSLVSGASAGLAGGILGSVVSWAKNGISIKGSDINNSFNKTYNTNINTTGATNNYRYTDISTTNNYNVVNSTKNYYYNPVTNNYSTYNQVSYNSTYNTYNFVNNEYNTYITNVNNTYVSYYIVDYQTKEEYYYEIYYQLPDGRNSYNLTADQVKGQYFVYDTVNYDEVIEDDGITLGLWHLDGNMNNSAASEIYNDFPTPNQSTYVESAFDGALLMDQFKGNSVTLNSPSGPFTLEYRIKVSDVNLSSFRAYNTNGTITGLVDDSFSAWNFFNIPEVTYTPDLDDVYGGVKNSITEPVVVGRWYSCAVVYDGSSYSFYLNGRCISNNLSSDFLKREDLSSYSIGFNTNLFAAVNYVSTKGTELNGMGRGLASYAIDEVRISNRVLYTDKYTPASEPFDTNSVLVVPESAEMTNTTIAVKSKKDVSGLRVGGVRPTYPTDGYVYVALEKDYVVSLQQYQNSRWVEIQGSLYLNGTWVTIYGFYMGSLSIDGNDSGSSGGSGGDSSGGGSGGSSGFWDKLLQSVFGGVLSVLASLLSGLLTLLSTILTMLLGLVGYIGIFLPFLPSGVVTLIGGGVFIVLALIVVKFIGNLL